MGVSLLSGIGWLVLSLCMGLPCIVTFLASMTLGFFVASTVYFGIAGTYTQKLLNLSESDQKNEEMKKKIV